MWNRPLRLPIATRILLRTGIQRDARIAPFISRGTGNVSQGSVYTSSYPGQFAARYSNTWGSSTLQLKIEYKKSTSQDWLTGATSSSTEVSANLNISEAATYDVRYLYGSTVRVSFQIKVNAMSESGTVDSHNVDDYTSEPYIKRTGTSTSASVVYNNTWGGSAAGLLKIVVDSVVVHELCHRKEMNHSAAFWAEVAKVLPDYKERRKFFSTRSL